jgi:hypothetical protein
MNKIVLFSEIVEENGKTIRENNMVKNHTIPLGALVEVENSKIRLFVVHQGRDCDGTPLYWLDVDFYGWNYGNEYKVFRKWTGGYSVGSLTIITLPEQNKPEWYDDYIDMAMKEAKTF